METHFAEEESTAMSQMRNNFTRTEQKVVEAEILKNLKPVDIGHLLRPLDRKEQIRWMKPVAEIPTIIIYLIMLPGIRKFKRTIGRQIQALKTGQQPVHHRPLKNFACYE